MSHGERRLGGFGGVFSKANSPYQNTQGSGFHFVSRWPRSVIARSTKWKRRSHDGLEYIYVRKVLLNKSQLRNVSNLSALPVGSGGNPSK